MTTTLAAALVSRYGLLAVFAGSLVEGEGILIAAMVLADERVLDPVCVWLAASTGAWLGHVLWFLAGRAIRELQLPFGPAGFRARATKVKELIEARPVTGVILLQYLYGARIVGAIAFGMTELSLLRFASYQIANCLVWAALIGGVAYLLGGLVAEIFQGWLKWIWLLASAGLVLLLLRFVGHLVERSAR